MGRLGTGLLLAIGLLSALWFLVGDGAAGVAASSAAADRAAAPGQGSSVEMTQSVQVASNEELVLMHDVRQAVAAAEDYAGQENATPELTRVHGRVLDEHGRPAAGVRVVLLEKPKPSAEDEKETQETAATLILPEQTSRGGAEIDWSDLDVDLGTGGRSTNFKIRISQAGNAPDDPVKIRKLFTDATGAFDFGEHRAIPMVIHYGGSMLSGPPLAQDVLPGGAAHMLYLPPRCFTGINLTLTAADGQPVPNPQFVQFNLRSRAAGIERAYRKVRKQDVTLSTGRVLAHGLAPGIWELTIVCDGASMIIGKVTVEKGSVLTPAVLQLTNPESATPEQFPTTR